MSTLTIQDILIDAHFIKTMEVILEPTTDNKIAVASIFQILLLFKKKKHCSWLANSSLPSPKHRKNCWADGR